MSGLFEGNRKVNQNTTWFAEGSFVYLPVCASLRREQENMGTCPLLHLARVFCHPSFHWLPTIQPTTTHPPYYQPTCLPVVFLQSSVFGLSVCPPPFLRHSSRHILTQTYSVKDWNFMVFKNSSQLMKYIYDILSVNWVGSKVLIRAGIRLGCLPREHLILLIRAVELGFCNDRHRSSKEPLAALPR